MTYLYQNITEQIIRCFYEVYGRLGYGFLEKVYEHSLMIELGRAGLHAKNQHPMQVLYKGEVVGDYLADILVEQAVVVELKAVEVLVQEHEAQLINYLKATNIEVGLLLNFGKRPEIRRKIFTNDRKTRECP
jgi:GxxExxY protein